MVIVIEIVIVSMCDWSGKCRCITCAAQQAIAWSAQTLRMRSRLCLYVYVCVCAIVVAASVLVALINLAWRARLFR